MSPIKRPVSHAIVMFTGFKETASHKTDYEELFIDVVRPFGNDRILTYEPRTWKTDVQELVSQLVRFGVREVAIISYSHGQAAAVDFAKIAGNCGISMIWLACAPVFRPSWVPRTTWGQVFAVRALIRNSAVIWVPESIRRVVYCRQLVDLPPDHELCAENPHRTIIEAPIYLNYGHTQIDGSSEWAEIVKNELTAWANPPKAIPVDEDSE